MIGKLLKSGACLNSEHFGFIIVLIYDPETFFLPLIFGVAM